jgi:hypothetical protein
MKGHSPVKVPAADILSVAPAPSADLFQDATGSNPTGVDVTFTGVTLVNFGPVYFEKSPPRNWFWMKPIRDAISNGDSDVSGFKFAPKPQIDFTRAGPFGFLTGVAISKNVSLAIASKGVKNYKTIAQTVDANRSASLKFLGMPLGALGTSSEHDASVATNDADASIQVNFKPSAVLAGDSMDSTAFVLGVRTEFPAEF